jgi:hypothetical protein
LDIYTPVDEFASMVKFLVAIGYDRGVKHLFYEDLRGFRCVQKMSMGSLRIDVIQSEGRSALGPIASFWTSAVRNGITPRGGFMSDPVLTSNGHGLLHHAARGRLHGVVEGRTHLCISKYAQRGFTFGHKVTQLPLTDKERWFLDRHPVMGCTHFPRYLGDRFTAVALFYRDGGNSIRSAMETGEWVSGGELCQIEDCQKQLSLSDHTIERFLSASEGDLLPLCCESYNGLVLVDGDNAITSLFK